MQDHSHDWWKKYFDAKYREAYSDFLTKERTDREIAFLKKIFPSNSVAILDVACGDGRHATALAKDGYRVVGVDYSESMLAVADHADSNPAFIRVDARDFDLGMTFDGAIMMFTALGYSDRKDDAMILKNIRSHLQDDGMFVLDLKNPLIFEKPPYSEGKAFARGEVTHVYDKTSRDWVMKRFFDDEERIAVMHVFSEQEIKGLLEACGFEPVSVFGDFDQSPMTETSPRMIVVSRVK